jgi:outer membrane protein assembly factor BamB
MSWGKGYCVVDVATGEIITQIDVEERIERKWRLKNVSLATALIASQTHVFAGDTNGRLHAWDIETSEPVWQYKPQGVTGYIGHRPIIVGNRLYINSFSDNPNKPQALYCYEQA